MKKSLIALTLICTLLLCGVCMAEAERTRLDAADRIVYRITNGKYRILDMDGKFIGDDYDAFPSDQLGECAAYMENGRFGYIAKDGTILVEPDYLELPVFTNGFAVVKKENIDAEEMDNGSGSTMFPTIMGVIDAYGDIVVPIEYSGVRVTSDGHYAVISVRDDDNNRKDGLFDLEQGKVAIEPQYSNIFDEPHDGTLIASITEKKEETKDDVGSDSSEYQSWCGVVSVQGEELVPFEYDRIEYNTGFNAYTCYEDEQIVKIYEIQNGTVIEKKD